MRGGWGFAALPGIFLSLRIRTMVDDVQSALSRVEGRVVGASLKVNLVLLAVAAIVVELFTVVSTPFLENVARAEVLQKARIMMEAAAGIRTYTSTEIAPLLNARIDGEACTDNSCIRSHQEFCAVGKQISRLCVSRSGTQPDESGKSRSRLGD